VKCFIIKVVSCPLSRDIDHFRIMKIHILLLYFIQVIIEPSGMFWRQIGGHLKKVETCSVGVTWGVGHDSTAWVYTSGWGGAFLKGI